MPHEKYEIACFKKKNLSLTVVITNFQMLKDKRKLKQHLETKIDLFTKAENFL
jgi:hypothetical protein